VPGGVQALPHWHQHRDRLGAARDATDSAARQDE